MNTDICHEFRAYCKCLCAIRRFSHPECSCGCAAPKKDEKTAPVGSALADAFAERLEGEPVSSQPAPGNASAKADPTGTFSEQVLRIYVFDRMGKILRSTSAQPVNLFVARVFNPCFFAENTGWKPVPQKSSHALRMTSLTEYGVDRA
jgi:hypothetical protein